MGSQGRASHVVEMTFDVLSYLRQHRIPFVTEGPDTSPGWLSVTCPFPHGRGIKDHGQHGGFNIKGAYYSCWICGWHPLEDVVMALSRIPYHEACHLVQDYQVANPGKGLIKIERPVAGVQGPLQWPLGSGPLLAHHKQYLAGRGYDPDYLEEYYQLKGTGPTGPYAYRIIVPVIIDGIMVSYQGRDWTRKQELPYKACAKEAELRDHKTVIYNFDHCPGPAVVVVEGVFDTWRLGDNCCCTFGIGWTLSQAMFIAERFSKTFILFDPEPKAQRKAKGLVRALGALGVDAKRVNIEHGDPGDMSIDESKKLMEDLLR